MTPEERSVLLDAMLDGDISEADFLRVDAELCVDPGFRSEYYRRIQLEWLLEREAGIASPSLQAAPAKDPSRWMLSGPLWAGLLLGIAASLLFAVVVSPWRNGRQDKGLESLQAEITEPSASGFAVLSGEANAVWAGGSMNAPSLRVGSLLPQGELHLESGLIHLELFSGVQMVIQGDALFSIDSPMQVSVQSGRVRAHVPEPAQGFRIKTSSGEVVDLGTEFTIDVEESGASLQVVDGEVEWHPLGSEVVRINDRKARQWSADGMLGESEEDVDLIGPTAFQQRIAQRQDSRMHRWKESRQQLRSDPRLIALYQVDPSDGWSRGLENQATESVQVASAGAVVAARRSEDRWGRENGALDFSQTGSRVRVNVPGEYHGLTLLCWVKINSLDRWYNSLFLTDGHQEREPHWQIMDDGRLFFSVKLASGKRDAGEPQHHVYYSPSIWDPSLSGRWVMLCTTYDPDARKVTHYVNGKSISSEAIAEEWLVDSIKIGPASICNWSEPMYRTDPHFVVRNLNGSLDEFALFSESLSADKILELFKTGNPNEP